MNKNKILVVDFGSQYTALLVRCIKNIGIHYILHDWNIDEIYIKKYNPIGIIISGGPGSTTQFNSPCIPDHIFKIGIPILGICYGMQAMVVQMGGKVQNYSQRECGYAQVKILVDNLLIKGIYDSFSKDGFPLLNVWMSHNDNVTVIPHDFVNAASTKNCKFAIIANEKKNFYGVQFHPEVSHTSRGKDIIKKFITDICKCKPSNHFLNTTINDIIYDIKKQVNKDNVILGLSGGVDSLVTALLLHKAINKQLICLFIDNGLLRFNEAKQIIEMFNKYYDFNVIHVLAENRFLKALIGITEPEEKRKIIGNTFINIFNEQALNFINVKWLAQGTIYPDIIESNTLDNKNYIKSHHNVSGLPKIMKLKLIEPIKYFFKDEVREIGFKLGLPKKILNRYPFPGPGLGIRILGEVKKEYCDILRSADFIFIEEIKKANLYTKFSQAFAIFLSIRTVGVIGDKRNYGWVIALRVVQTIDFMTANWTNVSYKFLNRVSHRIINEINEVSRVVYDISNKPPATIEWE